MIKLQVNNLQVLEKIIDLIVPDESAKLEVKSAIIQEFTNKYLKGVMNDEIKKELGNIYSNIKQSINAEIREELIKQDIIKRTPSLNLHDDFKNKIKQFVSTEVSNVLNQTIIEVVKEKLTGVEITKDNIKTALKEILSENLLK